mmetsp:Transcript_3412/g.15540  ORF Transcript_3412/g.15540 Transcript_3412/m.15540 type:complete len:258 (-) Transcript_3412:970-1743(-)
MRPSRRFSKLALKTSWWNLRSDARSPGTTPTSCSSRPSATPWRIPCSRSRRWTPSFWNFLERRRTRSRSSTFPTPGRSPSTACEFTRVRKTCSGTSPPPRLRARIRIPRRRDPGAIACRGSRRTCRVNGARTRCSRPRQARASTRPCRDTCRWRKPRTCWCFRPTCSRSLASSGTMSIPPPRTRTIRGSWRSTRGGWRRGTSAGRWLTCTSARERRSRARAGSRRTLCTRGLAWTSCASDLIGVRSEGRCDGCDERV